MTLFFFWYIYVYVQPAMSKANHLLPQLLHLPATPPTPQHFIRPKLSFDDEALHLIAELLGPHLPMAHGPQSVAGDAEAGAPDGRFFFLGSRGGWKYSGLLEGQSAREAFLFDFMFL